MPAVAARLRSERAMKGEAMCLLAQNWWAVALRGGFAILFGVLALLLPGITLGALILLWGVYAVVDGVFSIISGVRAARRSDRWGALMVGGVIGILAGLIAVFLPAAAAVAFVYLFAAWALVSGIIEIVAAIRLRREIEGEWLLGLTGVVSVLLGLYAAVFPGLGLLGLIWAIGVYAIIIGAMLLMLAFRLRRHAGTATQPAHP
jgi:uncharacterized membrane protein HdeD (DUF308 family)